MLGVGDTAIYVMKGQNGSGEVMWEPFQCKKELNRIGVPVRKTPHVGPRLMDTGA